LNVVQYFELVVPELFNIVFMHHGCCHSG
jgi:hypothetical protein